MSSAFKKQMQQDISNIFLNVNEFSDMHNINNKNIPAQVDEAEATEKEVKLLGYGDGVYTRRLILYVAEKDFGSAPSISSLLILDGKKYVVAETQTDMGLHAITLEANKSGSNRGR
jgi:hypothetical protein